MEKEKREKKGLPRQMKVQTKELASNYSKKLFCDTCNWKMNALHETFNKF